MGFFCLHLFFFFSWARRSWLAQVFFCFLFFVFAFIFISKYFGQWWEDREAWPVNWMSLRSQILSRNHSWKNYSNESLRKNKMTVLDQVSRTQTQRRRSVWNEISGVRSWGHHLSRSAGVSVGQGEELSSAEQRRQGVLWSWIVSSGLASLEARA